VAHWRGAETSQRFNPHRSTRFQRHDRLEDALKIAIGKGDADHLVPALECPSCLGFFTLGNPNRGDELA